MQNISRIYDRAARAAVETVLTGPNRLLAAILSRGQSEPITVDDLREWWSSLPGLGYRPNSLAAAAFIIGARHGTHNDPAAPRFTRWADEQVAAAEQGWIYGRSRARNPVLCPVLTLQPA